MQVNHMLNGQQLFHTNLMTTNTEVHIPLDQQSQSSQLHIQVQLHLLSQESSKNEKHLTYYNNKK